MNISVGHLHSLYDLCLIINHSIFSVNNFKKLHSSTITTVPLKTIFRLSQELLLIDVDLNQSVQLSNLGKFIVEKCALPRIYLRYFLYLYIKSYKPTWAHQIPHGREEFKSFISKTIIQIFNEADLFNNIEQDTISWWDKISDEIRGEKDKRMSLVGRFGEIATLCYEEERIGKKPQWVSIESNFAGYDVLSEISKENKMKMPIEVKASQQDISNAKFFITRNEWCVAEKIENFKIYLWALGTKNHQLCIIGKDEIQHNIPTNINWGKWETTSFPFNKFFQRYGGIKFSPKLNALTTPEAICFQ